MASLSTSFDTIECPHCHQSFPITSALQHLIEPLKNELKKEAFEKEQALKKWAVTLKEKEAEVTQAEDEIEKKVTARVQETQA